MQIPVDIKWSSVIAGLDPSIAAKIGINIENSETMDSHILKLSVWFHSKSEIYIPQAPLYINDIFIKYIDIDIKNISGALWGEDKIALIYYEELKIDKAFNSIKQSYKIELRDMKDFLNRSFIVEKDEIEIKQLDYNIVEYYFNNEKLSKTQIKYYGYDLNLLSINSFDKLEELDKELFSHWSLSLGAEEVKTINNNNMVFNGGTLSIYYNKKPIYCNIKFITETEIINKEVLKDSSLKSNLPNIEEQNGYIYSHWSNTLFGDSIFGEDNNDIKVSEDAIYYLVRKPKKITVSYKDELNKTSFQENYDFNKVIITNNKPTCPTQYIFRGWIDEDDNFYASNTQQIFLEDTTLTAHWEDLNYIIYIDNKKYTTKLYNIEYKIIYNEENPIPTEEGFIFKGLSTNKEDYLTNAEFYPCKNNQIIIPANINHDLILYSVFVKEYKIEYSDGQTDILELQKGKTIYKNFEPRSCLIYRQYVEEKETYEYFSHWEKDSIKFFPYLKYNLNISELFGKSDTINFEDIFSFDQTFFNNQFLFSYNEDGTVDIQAKNFKENMDSITITEKEKHYPFFSEDTLQANKIEEALNKNGFFFENNESKIYAKNFIEKEFSSGGSFIGGLDKNIDNGSIKILSFKNADINYMLKLKD